MQVSNSGRAAIAAAVRTTPNTAILLACLAALALPAAAFGATASVRKNPNPSYQEARAIYRAEPGELNRVTVTAVDPHNSGDFVVTFRDAGAPVKPGAGCVALGPNEARCAAPGLNRAHVHLHDGDDSLAAHTKRSQYYVEVTGRGGGGADTLTGSPRRDDFQGGAGSDVIAGRGGPDRLAGGTGSDTLDGGPGGDGLTGEYFDRAAPPASDRIDGGRGREDSVSYYGGRAPVSVDLARTDGNGAAGENDTLAGIEDARLYGGTGTLSGDDGRNDLRVGRAAGGAVVRGRGGSDVIYGGDNPDVIHAGRGNDYVAGGGGMGDSLYAGRGHDTVIPGKPFFGIGSGWSRAVHCGRGSDVVHESRRHDILSRDCEQASSYDRLGISPDLRTVGGDAVELSLHRRGPHTGCRYAIRLRAPFPQRKDARPREIGRAVFRLDRKTWRRIRIELNDYGRRLVARKRPVPVWVQPGERYRCKPRYRLDFGPDGFTALI